MRNGFHVTKKQEPEPEVEQQQQQQRLPRSQSVANIACDDESTLNRRVLSDVAVNFTSKNAFSVASDNAASK